MQERLEASPIGRAIISAGLVVVILAIVLWNMPNSALRRNTLPVTRRVLVPVGLDQAWNVFAPDPRRQVIRLEARITYDDGSTGVWHLPTGDPLIGEYRLYRWQKLMEQEIQDAHRGDLWKPLAQWVARTHGSARRKVAEVQLVRQWYDLSVAGRSQGRRQWREYTYYTWDASSL